MLDPPDHKTYCDRCDDTGSYEVRSSQRFYTDVETVRCACVADGRAHV